MGGVGKDNGQSIAIYVIGNVYFAGFFF